MPTTRRSMEQIIEEQVQRWQMSKRGRPPDAVAKPVVTVSREPGSGGRLVARTVADGLGFDYFHQELIQAMAASAKVENRVLETLDEKGLNTLEHWISSLADRRHLWPDQHLQHLMRVLVAIARHGGAVIVGRGGNFALPPENTLRVRIVGAFEERIGRVAEHNRTSRDEARRRILRTESERRAFVRKYFYADIADPIHYDLVVNTDRITVDNAAQMISAWLPAKAAGQAPAVVAVSA